MTSAQADLTTRKGKSGDLDNKGITFDPMRVHASGSILTVGQGSEN